jgi:hypothetical protein
MKNPAYLGKPAAWVASPLPQKHTDVDFELELESISQTKGKRLIDPDFSFVSKVQASVTKENEPESQKGALECKCTELSGSWGTRSLWNYPLFGNNRHSGYPYPPEEKILRFRFEITAKKNYPYPRAQALLIAKAKIAADGISLEAPPQILTSYGVLSVDIDDIKTGEEGYFRCKTKANWADKSERLAGEAMLGQDNRVPVCFIGDASASSGEAHDSGHGYSSRGDVTEITRTDEWIGPLSPGDEIYIGTVTPLPTREVFFTFEP